MRADIMRRILSGEDPRELGRHGGRKAASLRRQRKAAVERQRRAAAICQEGRWSKDWE